MIPNRAQLKKKFVEELQANPVAQVACQKTGIIRSTYYRWAKLDKKFKKNCTEARKISTPIINDLAESTIINMIKDGNLKAAIFWLNNNHPKYRKNSMKYVGLHTLLENKKHKEKEEIEKSREEIRELLELAKKFPPTNNETGIVEN